MSARALMRHVRAHESPDMCDYADALLDERRELKARIAKVSRYGYTEAARATVRRAAWRFLVFLMVSTAYLIGQAGH